MTHRNLTASPNRTSNAGKLPWLALGLILACVAVAGYKLAPSWRGSPVETLPARTCNPASEHCTAALPGGGTAIFSVSPAPIRPLQALQLEVSLADYSADRVEVDFTGVSMDMGTQRSLLAGTEGRLTGQAMLPVCTTGAMEWSATLRLTSKSGSVAIPFHFKVPAR